LANIPVAGFVALSAPPKFNIIFPVADDVPPTSLPVSPKVKGVTAAKPIKTIPALVFEIVFV